MFRIAPTTLVKELAEGSWTRSNQNAPAQATTGCTMKQRW
jgi:hypothetical protein